MKTSIIINKQADAYNALKILFYLLIMLYVAGEVAYQIGLAWTQG